MSSLKNLIALNKAKKEGVIKDDAVVSNELADSGNAAVDDDSPSTASVPSAAADEAIPAATRLGGLNLLKRAASGNGSGSPQRVVQSSSESSASATITESGLDGSVEFSLDDLAGFDETIAPAVQARDSGSGFLDEIEATAPDRDLPADLESAQLAFVESLDGIYQVLNDPEMFGQSVRIIMMELQENPEYIKLISDQDVHTMIRAMRNTMGLARIKKQEKTRKTSTAAKSKKNAVPDAAMNILDSMFGDSDD